MIKSADTQRLRVWWKQSSGLAHIGHLLARLRAYTLTFDHIHDQVKKLEHVRAVTVWRVLGKPSAMPFNRLATVAPEWLQSYCVPE